MIRLIRSLIGLPFEVLGGLLGALDAGAGAGLLKAAWWVNGNGRTAVRAASLIRKQLGRDAALIEVQGWLAWRPRVELATFAGLLHLEAAEADDARTCLELGKQLGVDRDGNLELLEFVLAGLDPDPDAAGRLARQLEPRRDLNGVTRKMVLEERLWQELLARRYDRAEQYARLLIEVAHNPQAQLALWAVCTAAGRTREAAGHLTAANLRQPHCWYFGYLAAAAIEAKEEAASAIVQLEEASPALADRARAEAARGRQATWT